jgi:hypothetical protein
MSTSLPVGTTTCLEVHLLSLANVYLSKCSALSMLTIFHFPALIFIHMVIHPFGVSICQDVHLLSCKDVHMSRCLFVRMSPTLLSECPSILVSTFPRVHSLFCLDVPLSICLLVGMSVYVQANVHWLSCLDVHQPRCSLECIFVWTDVLQSFFSSTLPLPEVEFMNVKCC